MNVYIFYNGNDYEAPAAQDDRWVNYSNENSPRLFLACAASWARMGFTPVRLTTTGVKGFNFKNNLKRDLDRYPVAFWNTWFVWKKLAPCLVCNMDVFNQRLSVDNFIPTHDAASMHVNGWTASIGWVTREFCEQAIMCIKTIDANINPDWNWHPTMYCDDAVIKQFIPPHRILHYCDFAYIKTEWRNAPLIQLPRCAIQRSMQTIPCV